MYGITFKWRVRDTTTAGAVETSLKNEFTFIHSTLLRPCILILKVTKFRKTFFRSVELIRVEVMKSRETLCHNDIQKEIHNWVRNG